VKGYHLRRRKRNWDLYNPAEGVLNRQRLWQGMVYGNERFGCGPVVKPSEFFAGGFAGVQDVRRFCI
jgi:hypothetical protein